MDKILLYSRDGPNSTAADAEENPPPSPKKVKATIMRLRNNKTADHDALPAELLKIECNE